MNSVNKGTMLFPHVSIDDLDFIPNSIGAHPDSLDVNYNLAGSVVFNTNPTTVTGMYLWDGEYWLKIGTATALPPLLPIVPTCLSTYYPVPASTAITASMIAQIPINNGAGTLQFLTFNLGANPNFSPKEQMAYSTPGTFPNPEEDVTVFGGLFQWGRKDIAHSLRCAIADKPEYWSSIVNSDLAHCLGFSSGSVNADNDRRAVGMAVRCIKD